MHTLAHEECYGQLLSAAFFAGRRESLRERIERRRTYLDSADPRIIALDAEDQIVGLADAGPGRDEDKAGALELYSIYTLAATYGSGLGKALLETAIGHAEAYLWVLEGNPRATAFYQKHGFQPDGRTAVLPPEWESLPELRMARPQQS